jgi:hypothetical protein
VFDVRRDNDRQPCPIPEATPDEVLPGSAEGIIGNVPVVEHGRSALGTD